jgi:hypothetical protein
VKGGQSNLRPVVNLHCRSCLRPVRLACVVLSCRYIGGAAGSSALSRPPPERRFEGIRLADGSGPAAPTGPLAHLQVRVMKLK